MQDFHCEEGAERGTRQSIVSWGTRTRTEIAVCSLPPFHFSPFNLHSSIYWFTVDRHGLRPRDDKSDGFPFHSSPFTLPSLAFLETYTEA